MTRRFPDLEIVFIESGGDNLSATFSPELADITLYVVDVSAGDKIPRKGGPGITRSDLLVINKTDDVVTGPRIVSRPPPDVTGDGRDRSFDEGVTRRPRCARIGPGGVCQGTP